MEKLTVVLNNEEIEISAKYLNVILQSGFAKINLEVNGFQRWAEELAQEIRSE